MAEASIKTNDLEVGMSEEIDPEKMNDGDKKLVIVMGLWVLVIMIVIIWFAIDTPDLSGFHDTCVFTNCGNLFGGFIIFMIISAPLSWIACTHIDNARDGIFCCILGPCWYYFCCVMPRSKKKEAADSTAAGSFEETVAADPQ